MLNQNYKIIDYAKENKIIIKNISLDIELDLFILISSFDTNFSELILNKIVDFSIDNISKETTYKDFSNILESVNSILKTWKQDNNNPENDTTIFIGILNKNNFLFSNIGKPSAYLIKNTNEVVEITEKEENKKEFNFISEGKLDYGDTIILSTSRLLNYLSYSDFTDSSIGKKAEAINKNIETILEDEKLEENIGVFSFKYNFIDLNPKDNKIKEKFNNFLLNLLDNKLVKKIIAYYMILKEKTLKQNKLIKNGIYLTGITVSIIILFFIISGIIGTTVDTKNIQANKENLIQAREFIKTASNNSNDPDIFDYNITKAEEIIEDLRSKQMFLSDLNKISEDLAIIKKQSNGIETFVESDENLIYYHNEKDIVKVIKVNKTLFLITTKNIIGPILPGKTPKKYAFNELAEDYFIDATPFGESIILITNGGKVVEFTKNGYFSYKDVKNQLIWEVSKTVMSYAQNIYLVSAEKNQILKHSKNGNDFNEGITYLNKEDSSAIGKIIDIAIDGGIYILKDDLSIVKFFSSPYRLENIVINKLPNNYDKENDSPIKIKNRSDLNYVYILLNNKIWVLEPNTRSFKDTKSLTYMGQIEGGMYKIDEFYVDHDGEINIVNENGIYELTFEVNDGKLIVR